MTRVSSTAPALGAMTAVHVQLRRAALFAGCALTISLLSSASAFAGCNSGNVANTVLLSAAGCQGNATGADATAVGAGANAPGSGASAFGDSASAGVGGSTDGDTALGWFSTATGVGADSATAVGAFATAVGGGATAVGNEQPPTAPAR